LNIIFGLKFLLIIKLIKLLFVCVVIVRTYCSSDNHTHDDNVTLQFSAIDENNVFKSKSEPKLQQNGQPIEIKIG